MKRYSASQLRQNLSRAFDEVERGEAVVVERHGRLFRIVPEAPAKTRQPAPPFFALRDRSLLDTGWTWEWKGPARPMRLRSGRKRRSSD